MPLVTRILQSQGDIEVIVYVDGSDDGSLEALKGINDDRLRVLFDTNRGRAWGIYRSVGIAAGQFAMIFDDDDFLDAAGVGTILQHLVEPLPAGVCGHIFHFQDEDGLRLGSAFGVSRSNFLALRADHGVRGDKKEVISSELFRTALFEPPVGVRRMPMSVVLTKLALRYDVLCHEEIIGTKHYLPGGTTAKVRKIRWREPALMARLHQHWVQGFFRRRYRSVGAFLRSILAGAAFLVAVYYRRLSA